jgi:hypothetical protein
MLAFASNCSIVSCHPFLTADSLVLGRPSRPVPSFKRRSQSARGRLSLQKSIATGRWRRAPFWGWPGKRSWIAQRGLERAAEELGALGARSLARFQAPQASSVLGLARETELDHPEGLGKSSGGAGSTWRKVAGALPSSAGELRFGAGQGSGVGSPRGAWKEQRRSWERLAQGRWRAPFWGWPRRRSWIAHWGLGGSAEELPCAAQRLRL